MTFQRLNSPWYLPRLQHIRFDKHISAQVVTNAIKNVGLDPVNGFALIADADHANGVGLTGMYGTLWAPISEAGPIMRDSAGSDDDIFRLELNIIPLKYVRDLSKLIIYINDQTLRCAGLAYQGSSWDYGRYSNKSSSVRLLDYERQPLSLPPYVWQAYSNSSSEESDDTHNPFCTHADVSLNDATDEIELLEIEKPLDLSDYTRSIMVNSSWFEKNNIPIIGFAICYKDPYNTQHLDSLLSTLSVYDYTFESLWETEKLWLFFNNVVDLESGFWLVITLFAFLCSNTLLIGFIGSLRRDMWLFHNTGVTRTRISFAIMAISLVLMTASIVISYPLYQFLLAINDFRSFLHPLNSNMVSQLLMFTILSVAILSFMYSKKCNLLLCKKEVC
jgi:hypothetical protein